MTTVDLPRCNHCWPTSYCITALPSLVLASLFWPDTTDAQALSKLEWIVFEAPPPFLEALEALQDPQRWEQAREHLFTMRIWHEHLSDSKSEWRGKVEHVRSREACYFREWSALIAFLQEVLSQ